MVMVMVMMMSKELNVRGRYLKKQLTIGAQQSECTQGGES